jgi:diguanylate cyclase (GGDEF)-like protein/PAS domain S-box-containing protein
MGSEAQDQIRQIVDASHDAFVAMKADGTITEWNRAAESLLGWSRSEAIGRTVDSTFLPGAYQSILTDVAASRAGPKTRKRIEVTALRRDGTELAVELTVWPVVVSGQLTFNAFVHDLSERLRFQEELRRLAVAATTDQGTGLKNRRGFFALAEHELSVARRLGQTLTFIFLDIDRLKHINDSVGHLEGDRAIADAAQILISTFRESDLVARLGGDEFCVLALGSKESSEQVIRRLEVALDEHNATANRPYVLSLSHGVAHYDPSQPDASLDDLISEADASMYESKLKRRPA